MNDPTIPPRPNAFTPDTSFSGGPIASDLTPTQEVVAKKPKRIVTRVDSLSRVLTVKFLSPLDRMRLAKIIGGKDAQNEVYLGYAALAFAVQKIDDEEASTNTVREIEFLVDRLGDEGLACVADCYQQDFAGMLQTANIELAKN